MGGGRFLISFESLPGVTEEADSLVGTPQFSLEGLQPGREQLVLMTLRSRQRHQMAARAGYKFDVPFNASEFVAFLV